MPKLPKPQITSIMVPGGDPADPIMAQVITEPTVGDILDISQNTDNPAKQSVDLLCRLVKGWNLTDDEGKELPVNAETIRSLPPSSFAFLSNYVAKNMDIAEMEDPEKKSTSSST